MKKLIVIMIAASIGFTASAQVTQTSSAIDPMIPQRAFLESVGVESINELVTDVAAILVPLNKAAVSWTVDISFVDAADGTGTATVVIEDADGDGIRSVVEFWTAASAFGVPANSDANVAVGTDGDQLVVVDATTHLKAITTADGELDITLTGNATEDDLVINVFGRLYNLEFSVTTE